ncbi:MAG: nitroreductase family protein [Candidatus Heimdallarchaeaceae archaeon]
MDKKQIQILDTCIKCLKCVEVCPRYIFELQEKKIIINEKSIHCHDCGHCLAVCPTDSIIHRMITHSLEEDFPPVDQIPSYEEFLELVRQRRSIRLFTKKEVKEKDIEKLIELGQYAPSGHNERKVQYTIIRGRKQIEYLLGSLITFFRKTRKQLNNPFFLLFAYLIGKKKIVRKAKKSLFRLESHINFWEKGEDKVFHQSSTLLLLHTDQRISTPVEDCNIAAQNILLGAQTLGLGATYIGYLVKSWNNSKEIRKIINLPRDHKLYACIALGYPKNKFKRLVPRPKPLIHELSLN